MSGRVTLRQVATYAGVSITTVSNVIRQWPYISDETRHRVEEAITELGYVPHTIAQGLRTGRTQIIGFIVPDLANPHFAAMVSITEAIAREHGYNVLIFNSRDDAALEVTCIHQVVNRWVDGLMIVQAATAQNTAELLHTLNIPVVAIDRVPVDFIGPSARIDNTLVSELAIDHLYSLGHRRIAHLSGPLGAQPAQERLNGYKRYLQEHQLSYVYSSTHEGTWGAESGYVGMRQILAEAELPTAVYASNDSMAIGALHALYERGLRVPEDISIIGVDDIELTQHLHPPLTTVRQPIDQMARAGIDMLLKCIHTESNPETGHSRKILTPELVIRESTAPVA